MLFLSSGRFYGLVIKKRLALFAFHMHPRSATTLLPHYAKVIARNSGLRVQLFDSPPIMINLSLFWVQIFSYTMGAIETTTPTLTSTLNAVVHFSLSWPSICLLASWHAVNVFWVEICIFYLLGFEFKVPQTLIVWFSNEWMPHMIQF